MNGQHNIKRGEGEETQASNYVYQGSWVIQLVAGGQKHRNGGKERKSQHKAEALTAHQVPI